MHGQTENNIKRRFIDSLLDTIMCPAVNTLQKIGSFTIKSIPTHGYHPKPIVSIWVHIWYKSSKLKLKRLQQQPWNVQFALQFSCYSHRFSAIVTPQPIGAHSTACISSVPRQTKVPLMFAVLLSLMSLTQRSSYYNKCLMCALTLLWCHLYDLMLG